MKLQGKHILIVGLGESGLAMARWLHRQGAHISIADSRQHPPAYQQLRAEIPGLRIHCGAFQAEPFAAAELVALSPGVDPCSLPATGQPVISEIDLFAWGIAEFAPHSKVIGITGSNGKTTVTALTAYLLNHASADKSLSAVACGNISPSALSALMQALDQGHMPEVWVLELSSFQLESTRYWRADAATLLNISEDHLDRHQGQLATYAAAKARIFALPPGLTGQDTAPEQAGVMVLNRDDPHSLAAGAGYAGRRVLRFGSGKASGPEDYGIAEAAIWRGQQRLIGLAELPLHGLHNACNIQAALALCAAIGVGAEYLLPALQSFKGLPHRLELVATRRAVDYFDDSKGTNVGATLAAIQGLHRPVAIILGGEGKGQDFTPLRAALAQHGRAVALIGRDAKLIAEAIAGCGVEQRLCRDMRESVDWLSSKAEAGDAVLLSPACASFDMYQNYVQRAQAFIEAVNQLQPDSKEAA